MSNLDLSGSQVYVTEKSTKSPSNLAGDFVVKCWGVRGLIPTPGSNTSRYGGNTACVEMRVSGKNLIFDGGTGLRILGKTWQHLQEPLQGYLFFTNSQSNRIQGFPFFAPAFIAENSFYIYGAAASNGASIKQCLCDQMLQPYFPYPLQVMQSELQFYYLTPSSEIKLDDVTITTRLINQTHCSIGYRVSWQNYNVAYVTDLSNPTEQIEREEILQLVQGVDLLIANAIYTPPTAHEDDCADTLWQAAVQLAQKANAKQLIISHHHPDNHDDFLDKVQTNLKLAFPNALLACEGLVIPIAD